MNGEKSATVNAGFSMITLSYFFNFEPHEGKSHRCDRCSNRKNCSGERTLVERGHFTVLIFECSHFNDHPQHAGHPEFDFR